MIPMGVKRNGCMESFQVREARERLTLPKL